MMTTTTEQIRNKYNTLTPAEAKKLNRLRNANTSTSTNDATSYNHQNFPFINQNTTRQLPVRTASVLHKPRAPPIVVTNLDTTIEQLTQSYHGYSLQQPLGSSDITSSAQPNGGGGSLTRSSSIRSASVGRDSRRHTINYGRTNAQLLNSRTSLYSTATSTVSNHRNSAHCNRDAIYSKQQQSPLGESISNLSFKSSLDTTDCGGSNYRLQTMSLDLGNNTYFNKDFTDNSQNNTQHRPLAVKLHTYDPMLQRGHTIARLKYNTISNASSKMFSDESYSSAKSDLSFRSGSVTPTRFGGGGARSATSATAAAAAAGTMLKTPRSASKASLSSSTYKVLQSPFVNFKKLFRNLPRPFSNVAAQDSAAQAPESHYNTNNHNADDEKSSSSRRAQAAQLLDTSCQSDQTTIGNISISDSMSQISLNKSQSPPVCPPPPGELKSMSYMESATVDYSNYDEFTRARNERVARQQAEKSARQYTGDHLDDVYQSKPATNSTDSDADSWQMTSLPVYYERNLTTVFEEKQASCELADRKSLGGGRGDHSNINSSTFVGGGSQFIQPPTDFDDNSHKRVNQLDEDQDNDITCEEQQQQAIKTSCSIQSLVSTSSTSDSALEFQQRQQQLATSAVIPSTPYRFSFGQPIQTSVNNQFQKNLGLPPRMPVAPPSVANSETRSNTSARQDNSSSGNSSNCSSQLNGINNCDRPNSLETTSEDKNSYVSDESTSNCCGSSGGYGNLNGLSNDADATILSDTSTLQGETGVAYYANRCNELERTVTTLKNKLIGKEKELTDLQLAQLNNDYAIERLRKQVNKLERENAQLKTMVGKS